jgi:hypothetical protein
MQFQVLYPYPQIILGDSFKNAVKNYIKINHDMTINRMIITDQIKKRQAMIDYYNRHGKYKAKINISPFMGPIPSALPMPVVFASPDYRSDDERQLGLMPDTKTRSTTTQGSKIVINTNQPYTTKRVVLDKNNPTASITISN